MNDPNSHFNARLQSRTDRAIEFHEGDRVPERAIQEFVRQALKLNNQNNK